jgi:hypothetical protein
MSIPHDPQIVRCRNSGGAVASWLMLLSFLAFVGTIVAWYLGYLPTPLRQWEYATLLQVHGGADTWADAQQQFTETNDNNPSEGYSGDTLVKLAQSIGWGEMDGRRGELDQFLNMAGDHGWELVEFNPQLDGEYASGFVFKRPKK